MEHARPPGELLLEGGPSNRADTWRKWLRQFKIFLKASGVAKEEKDVQASLLLNIIGADGYDVYSTFRFAKESDREDIDKLIEQFNSHFGTKTNTILIRFKFFTRNQEVGENIDEYVTALKILSSQCEFDKLEESLVRDRIVCGVVDASVRDRLLRTEDLTLEKAVKICQANEISCDERQQIESVKRDPSQSVSVHSVRNYQYGNGRYSYNTSVNNNKSGSSFSGAGRPGAVVGARAGGGAGSRGGSGPRPGAGGAGGRGGLRRACASCADVYCDGGDRCAARKVKCFNCNMKGHYKVMCPARKPKKVYEVNEYCENDEDERDGEDLYFISTIENICSISKNASQWYEQLIIAKNNVSHRFKLDTGSDLNVLSKSVFINMGYSLSDIKPVNIKAKSVCGNLLEIIGSCVIQCRYKNIIYKLDFVIMCNSCESILGKEALEELCLIKRIYSIDMHKYDDLFHGLGKLPGTYSIPLENNAYPCICPVRKIAVGIRDRLQVELSRMESLGVIRKVTHPTSWVNGIVVAPKKDGSLRVCLDPRPLNKVVRRQHYPLPTLTEIATKLKGACFFSKLDAKSGFWMIQLDDRSADLCTFGTPFGRYQYLRLPYGINSATEVFHAKIRQLLEDLEGVDSFVDDVIIWGATKEEHDRRLSKLLDRSKEIGIKYNKEKCQIGVTEVTYLGHTFSSEGMKIDESKVKAIMEMPTPNDRQSLERFLGMVNYMSKFISNCSEKVIPLRNLLKQDVEWVWSSMEEQVVSELKRELCSAPVLALFCPRTPATVSVDASSVALGAVLLQEGRAVEYASTKLTDTQRRYSQIEKEMLAIVFALERFHQYIFGKCDIIVESDHKPLEALFKKPLDSVPARLQRMMLRVQRYDFQVVYKPGKYMYVADTLSRAALPEVHLERVTQEIEEQTCFLIANVRFSSDRLLNIKQNTLIDSECIIIKEYILNGWPSQKHELDERVRMHWSYRESFEYADGVIFVNNLVFIPKSLRAEMISRVHEGHLGIDRCKRRARDVMFWGGMSSDVEAAVRACRVCAERAPRPQREPMIPHQIPDLPWAKVGSDIFEYKKKYFLIIVDYYSNFVEVSPLNGIGSRQVISAMKDQFARHGIPQEVFTDNGPAYGSREFKIFAGTWGFVHNTSSPNYPTSNGRSERTVRTIKSLLDKSEASNNDFYLSLLNFRATPRDGISSPCQLLMGRRVNTRLPAHENKLRPDRNNGQDMQNILHKQMQSAEWYNAKSRALPELTAGDEVVALDAAGRRHRAVVSGRAPQPRSYWLTDAAGRMVRRNRRHLIRLQELPAYDQSGDQALSDEAGPSSEAKDDVPPSSSNSNDQVTNDPYASCESDIDADNNTSSLLPKPTDMHKQRAAKITAKEKLKNLK